MINNSYLADLNDIFEPETTLEKAYQKLLKANLRKNELGLFLLKFLEEAGLVNEENRQEIDRKISNFVVYSTYSPIEYKVVLEDSMGDAVQIIATPRRTSEIVREANSGDPMFPIVNYDFYDLDNEE